MTLLPNSAAARDVAYLVHPQTNLKVHETQGPVIITKGEGVYVFDENGKKYIEAMAGLWCASLGFSEKRLVDAATQQLSTLPYYHQFHHRSHLPSIDLAEKLIEIAPAKMSKVLFQASGSEANDTAVKLIRYYHNAIGKPAKKKIIGRIKGYHGITMASASLTGIARNHQDFDLPLPGFIHTDCPHYWRYAEEGETEEDFATRCAASLEKLILDEGPDTVAAMFMEPVMGAGGVIVPPKTYYEKIQAVLRKYEVLVVADEVITGFGRTGNMWGCQTMGIQPDMLTCAKALSASYMPISALMITDPIYQAMVAESEKIGVFGHGFTYGGHPVCAAVANETLKIYEERDIIGHVRKVGPRLQEGLRRFSDHPLVGEVRGVGLIAAVEVVKDPRTKEAFDPAAKIGTRVADHALEDGLMVRAMLDSIAFTPPLIITEAEIDAVVDRFGRALDKTWAEVKSEGLSNVA